MPSILQDFETATTAAIGQIAPGIVAVGADRSAASGFAWQPGLIVTSDEALAEADTVEITSAGGARFEARVAGRDPSTAIAVLRHDQASLAPVALAERVPPTGGVAIAVGWVRGAISARSGIVAASGGAWRSMRGGAIDARIELDLRTRGALEGGLVLGADGAAFGMLVHGPRRRALAIPSATIARVAAKLAKDGRIAKGYLGLGLYPVKVGATNGTGLMVMSVDPGGPGAAAGMHQGDVIESWNGGPVPRGRAMMAGLGSDSVGTDLALGVRRGGQSVAVTLKVAERPAA